MADIEKLKALAEKASKGFGSCSPAEWMEFRELSGRPATVLELIAELKELRRRAAYWKQRAKSAEGHLYAGDMKAAMRELHKRTTHAGTPWEDLSVSRHAQIQGAALAVVGAINSQRDRRLPADSQETAHG